MLTHDAATFPLHRLRMGHDVDVDPYLRPVPYTYVMYLVNPPCFARYT